MYNSLPKSIQSYNILLVISAGPFHCAQMRYVPNPLCRVLFRRRQSQKTKANTRLALFFWCGRRESNPRLQLGKLTCYHYTTPANRWGDFITLERKSPVQNFIIFYSCFFFFSVIPLLMHILRETKLWQMKI